MFEKTTLIAYLAASAAIILSPGPAQALMLARTISDGRKAGVITAVGLNVATIIHALAAAIGLSAILATSAMAFAIVKYLGAAYLVYLGIKTLRAREHREPWRRASAVSLSKAFNRAIITGLLNPKVAIFFLAFLPQFVNPRRGSTFLQFVLLGLILASLDLFYESTLALVTGTLGSRLMRNARFALWRQRLTGTVLIGLGVRLAFVVRR